MTSHFEQCATWSVLHAESLGAAAEQYAYLPYEAAFHHTTILTNAQEMELQSCKELCTSTWHETR